MNTKNETSSLMQGGRDEDNGVYETYNYGTRRNDNEVYETPYDNQYDQPYKDHTYAEYEKPKNEAENNNKKKILLVVVIVLLIAGLTAGIGSYFIMTDGDSEPEETSEGSTKSCEFNRNAECLDAVCNEDCSQCKNYRQVNKPKLIDGKYKNDTCVLPEDRQCVLESWCDAEIRPG